MTSPNTIIADIVSENETLSARLAELEKQEPVCWMTPSGEGWMMRTEPPVTDTKLGWTAMFTTPVVSPDVGLMKLIIEQKVGSIALLESMLDSAQAENQSLKTELEAARKDAERYKWLRWTGDSEIYLHNQPGVDNCAQLGCEYLDAIIDAAIEQAKGGV